MKENLQRLVQLYEATGEPGESAEWKKKLADFDKTEAEKAGVKPASPPAPEDPD